MSKNITQEDIIYLMMELIDSQIKGVINLELIDPTESGMLVMNVIINLISTIIINSYEHGTSKAQIAVFMKDALEKLAAYSLEKMHTLPDDPVNIGMIDDENPLETTH
jgi:hypothetical protein